MNVCERRARKGALKCKFGPLASPDGGRCCRKPPRKKRTLANVKCKHGALKHPVGGRRCRRRPPTSRQLTLPLFNGYRRRRRR